MTSDILWDFQVRPKEQQFNVSVWLPRFILAVPRQCACFLVTSPSQILLVANQDSLSTSCSWLQLSSLPVFIQVLLIACLCSFSSYKFLCYQVFYYLCILQSRLHHYTTPSVQSLGESLLSTSHFKHRK